MFRNYLVTTLRALLKYRGFSLINILGLAISMSVCLVIILFIKEETGFDQFHKNKDRIYRVNSTVQDGQGMADNLAAAPAPMAEAVKTEYAAVEQAVTLARVKTTAIEGENSLAVSGLAAGPAFFDIFSFELVAGDARTALSRPFTAVLSDEVARKMFGDNDPVGRTLELDQIGDVMVTGVIRKPARKSHFDRYFEMMLSFSTIEASGAQNTRYPLDDWKSISRFYTYLLLAEGTQPTEIESALSQIVQKYYPDSPSGKYAFFLQALTDIRLGPNLSNKIERQTPATLLYVLGLLAFILTLTASFNYMNLSVARSLKRAKEVGIRKVSGAFRKQIVAQFLGEAIMVSWVALAIALLLLEVWLIPAFNNLGLVQGYLQTSISLHFWTELSAPLIFMGFATAVGILAGLYPALIFSSYTHAHRCPICAVHLVHHHFAHISTTERVYAGG
jgi:putative ABC transport system permease protein